MKILRLPLISGVVWLAVLECSAAEVDPPDCVGIRPGMPVTEVRERLKAYDPKLEVQAMELPIPSLGEKPVLAMLFVVRKPTPSRINYERTPGAMTNHVPVSVPISDAVETLQAEITLPPNKPVVWKVFRSLRFEQGEEKTRTALFAALAEKYGKESLTIDQGFGKITRYWLRSPQGTLLESQTARECCTFGQAYVSSVINSGLSRWTATAGQHDFVEGLATILYTSGIEQMVPAGAPRIPGIDPPTKLQDGQQCQTMTYVIAELSVTANPELVDHLQIAIVDAGLDARAKEATRALHKHFEGAKQEQRVEKAKQQPIPKL